MVIHKIWRKCYSKWKRGKLIEITMVHEGVVISTWRLTNKWQNDTCFSLSEKCFVCLFVWLFVLFYFLWGIVCTHKGKIHWSEKLVNIYPKFRFVVTLEQNVSWYRQNSDFETWLYVMNLRKEENNVFTALIILCVCGNKTQRDINYVSSDKGIWFYVWRPWFTI